MAEEEEVPLMLSKAAAEEEEVPLILSKAAADEEGVNGGVTWKSVLGEGRQLLIIAAPMVAFTLSNYMQQVISVMMVGHLGEVALSSTAMAMSFAGVTGFSLILGMASGMETTCGQAYGAQQYQKLGTQMHTAVFSLFLVCIPVSVVWAYVGRLLVLLGQDPVISAHSGRFMVSLIPAVFGYAALQPLIRYFQMQSLVGPMLLSSCLCISLHIPLCYLFVFRTRLGNLGGALSIDISIWLNVVFLYIWMRQSPSCSHTRVPLSLQVFHGMREFFRFAVPSAGMTCLEWWSFELLVLLSGLLQNPALETSVLSICLSTISTLYTIPYGFGAAASTRVSNELGAGNPEKARLTVCAALIMVVGEATVVSVTLFSIRRVFGYCFSNVEEVVNYVTDMTPLLCISVFVDSLHGVLSGVARGCGWQHIGAYVNLGAYYLFGIPTAVLLGFFVGLRGKGLWIGILSGAALQVSSLFTITGCTNWEKQGEKVRERLLRVPQQAVLTGK